MYLLQWFQKETIVNRSDINTSRLGIHQANNFGPFDWKWVGCKERTVRSDYSEWSVRDTSTYKSWGFREAVENTCLIGVLRESGLERSVEQYLGLMELARQCSRGHIHGSGKPYIKKRSDSVTIISLIDWFSEWLHHSTQQPLTQLFRSGLRLFCLLAVDHLNMKLNWNSIAKQLNERFDVIKPITIN